jgi:general secretion pathway protein F
MALFEYKAISNSGKKFIATIDADNIEDAKSKLLKKQILVLSLEILNDKKIKSSISKQDLLNFTREITRLLQAGLPLYETLSALEEKYDSHKIHRILLSLLDSLKAGLSFSKALSKHPEIFDLLYISMVANAEKTGRLCFALEEITNLIAKQQVVRKKLTQALMYPGLLSIFCLVVLSSLLFYVVPSLKELFDGKTLHPFTQLVFTLSDGACKTKPFLIFSFVSFLIVGFLSFFLNSWKTKIYGYFLKMPFFNTLFMKVAIVRFTRAVSTLLEGGLPLVMAFEQARGVTGHPLLEKIVENAEKKIIQGEAIYLSFENQTFIPSLIPRMIAIAEQGGRLSFMMNQIAQIYEEELEKSLTNFANLAQPILLLVLGAVIGFVLLSVLLPLTDVSSFATS